MLKTNSNKAHEEAGNYFLAPVELNDKYA